MIEDRWYKNAVIYSLEVETFLDANGDGIGDFEGLIRRLEYLQYLGVDAFWLAPFHPSPNRDNGYDVSDFYGVHPRYGSSGDFVELVHQASKHGLRVLMDLVVNHRLLAAARRLRLYFFVNQHLFYALATHDIRPLTKAIEATLEIPPHAQWAHFLRNHDELDLGRLTEKQRERVFARFAPDEHMRLYGRGIRRRLAPMLGDREHEELAYSAMFSLPGSPVIRFGDELRMGDDLGLEQREAVRTPMQWADEPHGGFTTSDKPVVPVVDHGVWGYEHVNVEAQRRDPSSFLSWMARMIRLRKECPEIGSGKCTVLDVDADNVLGLRFDWHGNSVVTLHNFDERPHEACLRLPKDGDRLSDLIDPLELRLRDGCFAVPLDALDYRWFRIGGLDYAARGERR